MQSIDTNRWLTPTKELLEEYESWWTTPDEERDTKLKKNFNLDFTEIRLGEATLNELAGRVKNNPYMQNDLLALVSTLDSVYHTRLKNPVRVARKLYELSKKEGLIQRITESDDDDLNRLVDTVATIDKKDGGAYIYSFATKFCSRLAPERYPIFDSIAAGLLIYYRDIHIKENPSYKRFTKSSLGSYSSYRSAYDELVAHTVGDGSNTAEPINLRHVDFFLWTYGKQLDYAIGQKHKAGLEISNKAPSTRGKDIAYKPTTNED